MLAAPSSFTRGCASDSHMTVILREARSFNPTLSLEHDDEHDDIRAARPNDQRLPLPTPTSLATAPCAVT